MKKFFAIAFIAATLVACNESGDKKETKDTTAVTPVVVDSPAVTPPVVVDSPAIKVDSPAVKP